MVEIEDNKEGKENNIENRKFSDDVHSIKEKEELLSERKQFFITLGCYCYALTMAIGFNKIIVLDSFNGSTVANYINIIAPCMFYLYFARDKKLWGKSFSFVRCCFWNLFSRLLFCTPVFLRK